MGFTDDTLRQDWLGTQHLPVHDEVVATAVLAAAREAGVTWLDTADVYGPRAGDVERFLATRRSGFRVATKVGLRRAEGRWAPDGRASAIDRAIDASLERLGAIELLWLHAVDPRVELAATGRALARALRDGRVPAVGVCNVSVAQLRVFADLFPVAAVQVELSRRDRAVVRSGVVQEARERGLPVLGYRPFQGRERSGRALADPVVARVAARQGASPAAVVLAWLRDLGVVPLPGTTDPLHVRDLTTRVALDERDRAELDADTELGAQLRRPRAARVPPAGGRRVVLVGGTPGAGKTRHTTRYADWVRLNRDTEGGTLEGLLPRLSAALDSGRDVVLDNTYATRAQRNAVLETSWRHGARVWCEWLDTPDAEAERNVVARLLDTVGHLVGGPELAAWNRADASVVPPRALHRFRAEVEPPDDTEGFEAVVRHPFVRAPGTGRPGLLCAPVHLSPVHPVVSAAVAAGDAILVADWAPGSDAASRAAALEAQARAAGFEVFAASCPHPAGPPDCWCRPPLPGLVLWLARRAGVDPAKVQVLAASPTDRALARRLSLELATEP